MFDDLVLGVDPGTASVGLAVVGRRGPRRPRRGGRRGGGRLPPPAVPAAGPGPGSGPMISLLDGRIEEKTGDRVLVSVAGVGYEVLAPALTLSRLPPMGRQARIFTRL